MSDGSHLVALKGDVDVARVLRAVPTEHKIKGVFLAANALIVASDWARIEPSLRAPPRGGKYLTFSDYPLYDHVLLSDYAARHKYRGLPTCEAHRLLSRATIDTFSKTTLGRIALTLVSGPGSLLMKYEEVFNRMVVGAHVAVKPLAGQAVELSYTSYYSTREAIFGVVEGAIMACDFQPSVEVESRGTGAYVATASWRAR
jgi:uncharacterized protein (TIGR02265 family)